MKLLLDIKDDKADFIMEVLKNFKDVKVKPLSGYKSAVLEGVQEAVNEARLIKSGHQKGLSAREILNEL